MAKGESLATGLQCLSCGETYPLDPKLFVGCSACIGEQFQAPLDVTYAYPDSGGDLLPDEPLPGLPRYAPLLPPSPREMTSTRGGSSGA